MSNTMKYWTNVIKRVSILAVCILLTIAFFKLALFYMPFLIAFVISLIMEPVIRFLMNKCKFSRRLSSIIVFIFTFSLIVGIAVWGIMTLISESANLLTNLNDYYNKIYNLIQNIWQNIDFNRFKVSNELAILLKDASISILEQVSNYIKVMLSNFLSVITTLPCIAIYLVITILALYFICTDKIYILDELEYHLPSKWMNELTAHIKELVSVLGGYLKAQMILIFISFLICLVGLYILYFFGLNVGFPLIIALGIAFVDALPILGSGTIMVPWGIFASLNGDYTLGISVVILWIIMSVIRQFIEPKIVSGNIGIHPIFTIIAMYTGFKFIGVIGMFIGPIVLIILKNIFSKFLDGGILKRLFDLK